MVIEYQLVKDNTEAPTKMLEEGILQGKITITCNKFSKIIRCNNTLWVDRIKTKELHLNE